MIVIDDFEKLKRKVATLQSRKDQITGAIKEVLKRLQREFGCKTLADAKRLLETLCVQERKQATAYTKEKRRFEKKWAKQLKEVNG